MAGRNKRRSRAIAKATARIQKKDPSYKYEGPAIINDEGVKITLAERDRLQQLTKRAEEKRVEMERQLYDLPRKLEGEEVGGTVRDFKQMGRETDFVLAPKTLTWKDFKSKEAFDRYTQRLEKIVDPDYIPNRIRQYKQNFTSSLLETYGDQARDIAMKIRMMKPMEYMKMVETDESLQIGYYADSDDYVPGMLNKLRRSLGMKEKEEWTEEER